MRYHLLGYVMVRGYDGSQSFTYNGEEVPPRTSVIHVDNEQQLAMKEEASCGRNFTTPQTELGKLSRWDILGESAEAKSILQRFLHPDVECAILNKNIYDSWKMLCALYGNRSIPGAHDMYEMHRVLYHIRLGDKQEEPVREFITRWEMLMQQYAFATGIELTDGFCSVSLVQTLPKLVEKVTATLERTQTQTETANVLISTVVKATTNSVDMQVAHLPKKSANSSEKRNLRTKSAEKPTTKPTNKPAEKQEKAAEQRAAVAPRTTQKEVPPPVNVTTGGNDTVDLTSGEVDVGSSSKNNKTKPNTRPSPCERIDRAATPRTVKSPKIDDRNEKNSAFDKRDYYKYDHDRSYDKYTYDMSSRKSRSRYDKKYDRFDSASPVSCFYCLKVGHNMRRCWYLKADIENGTTHDLHKKYSCAVTIDRNQFMVNCLEAYIDEVNREHAAYGTSTSAAPRSHGDYEVSESVGRQYHSKKQRDFTSPSPREFGFKQSPTGKRSHRVFQMPDGRMSSRDPRLNRSRSVYGSTHATDEFSPRKRSRTPSFERQLQSYY
ncbi:hypothetical protein PHMEG_00014965 [Phytophthora megakarya]|uniref:Uncharacterized protein n=1 Tax=Phytophthora megakarya TaxID=4795 RepID=A0A225W2H9_9STRA|nr:hypothetical protein PHMEG_00014965 [Phytophthora megakarya]